MEWTKEKPTEVGYYWFLSSRQTKFPQEIDLLKVIDSEKGLQIWLFMSDEEALIENQEDGFWMGPIRDPERPK